MTTKNKTRQLLLGLHEGYDIQNILDESRITKGTLIDNPMLYEGHPPFTYSIENLVVLNQPAPWYVPDEEGREEPPNKDREYKVSFDLVCVVKGLSPLAGQRSCVHYESDWKQYQKFCALRHDFVASRLTSDTDKSLSEFGILSRLTPDCLNVRDRTVLELATNASGQPKSMESSYRDKRISYETILQNNSITYYILVVSPHSVLTNIHLGSECRNELMLRCSIGMSLVSMIEKEMGFSLNSDEEMLKSHKEIRQEFIKFNEGVTLRENEFFDKELMNMIRDPTEEEFTHAKGIFKKTLRDALTGKVHVPEKDALLKYLAGFTSENTRTDCKLITVFPCVISRHERIGSRDNFRFMGLNRTCPSSLYKICATIGQKSYLMREKDSTRYWRASSQMKSNQVEEKISKLHINHKEAKGIGIHELRRTFIVKPFFSQKELDELALDGVQAKSQAEEEHILAKEAHSKKSFHPDTITDDVEEFWRSESSYVEDEQWVSALEGEEVYSFIENEKLTNPLNLDTEILSNLIVKHLRSLKVVQWGELISDICCELAYEYKVATRPGEWIVKPLRKFKAILFVYPTSTHCFFFLAFDKDSSQIIDTGNIGPKLYETDNYWVSSVTSVTESYLEHYVKAGQYILMIAAHLLQMFKVPVATGDWMLPVEMVQNLNYMVLTYLNNKSDNEELLTNLRFFYMKLLQEVDSNVYDIVDRLPTVLRSRLTVFGLKRLRSLITYYSSHRITRVKMQTQQGVEWEWKGIKVVYHDATVSIDQLIDSFYYSYVVTKLKSSTGDHTVAIFNKISKEQMSGIRNVKDKGLKPWGLLSTPTPHRWDYAVELTNIQICKQVLRDKHGPEVMELIRHQMYLAISRIKFSDISSLKASSKDYTQGLTVPPYTQGMTRKEYLDHFNKLNKHLQGKRPRVITTLVQIIEVYKGETGDQLPTPIKVCLWAARSLNERGWFFSDAFIKDQHNGVREIHVLEILARLVQYLSECMAKVICKMFENDTVCSPHTKKTFYLGHEKNAEQALGQHITYGASSDASKWCQRNETSQFFVEMASFSPEEMRPFLYVMYYLWTVKRIGVSPMLLQNLDRNRQTYSTNPDFIALREAYHTGTAPFIEPRGGFMEINYGMMQGICHSASCLKHDIKQTAWKAKCEILLNEEYKIPSTITIAQGSDDSAALISTNQQGKYALAIIVALLWWKEALGAYVSIWCSYAKSSIGTVSLVEYNSDWYICGRNVKPVFRWNSACLETSLVERLPERVEQFYNGLSESLQSGSTTLLCSVVQTCQASLHYQIMGLTNSLLSDEVLSQLGRTKQVSLGYFPLELEQICGLTGFDYQLYLLSKRGVEVRSWDIETNSKLNSITYDGKIDRLIRSGLKSFAIRFRNISDYNDVVEKTGLPKVKSLLEKVANHPELLYVPMSTWEQEELKMALILDQPSVRASLSGHQATIRMTSAGAYLLNNACVSGTDSEGVWEKRSLLNWLRMCNTPRQLEGPTNTENPVWFCHQAQYDEYTKVLESMKNFLSYQPVHLRRAYRNDLLIWGNPTDVSIPLIDMVKRKWFSLRTVKCSETVFDQLWRQLKARFPFLQDRYIDTMSKLDLDDITFYKFLQSIAERTRVVHLSDTTSKGSDLWGTSTRLFWPDTKVRAARDLSEMGTRELKHSIHCVLSYFYRQPYSLSIVKDLICESSVLKTKLSETPYHLFKLKIFRDFLRKVPQSELIHRIERSKIGILGFFKRRQEKTKSGYKGRGEWIGNLGGVDARVVFLDKEIMSVTLQRLTDIQSLGKSLKTLFRDFRSTISSEHVVSRSSLYVDINGNITRSDSAKSDVCPLIIEQEMDLNIHDKLIEQSWYLTSEGDTLKLCFNQKGAGISDTRLTILSESFGSHHWDPTLPSPDLDDSNFSSWCRGLPCKPMTLLQQAQFPTEESDVQQLAHLLEKREYQRDDIKYDLPKLLKYLREFTKGKVAGHSFLDLKYDYTRSRARPRQLVQDAEDASSSNSHSTQYKELVSRLTGLEGGKVNFESIQQRWSGAAALFWDSDSDDIIHSDISEEDEGETLEDVPNVLYSFNDRNYDPERLEELAAMFESYDDVLEQLREAWTGLYRGNLRQIDMFFSSFLDVFEDMSDSKIILGRLQEDPMKPDASLEMVGVGGALIHVLFNLGTYKATGAGPANVALDTLSHSGALSMSHAQGGRPRSPAELEAEEAQISALLPNLTGPLHRTMSIRLRQIRAELLWLRSIREVEQESSLVSSIDKRSLFLLLYKRGLEGGAFSIPLMHRDESVMSEIMLNYISEECLKWEKEGDISNVEAERMRAALNAPITHPDSLKAYCLYAKVNLSIRKGQELLYGFDRHDFYRRIEITM